MTDKDITEELTRITDDLHALVFSIKVIRKEIAARAKGTD